MSLSIGLGIWFRAELGTQVDLLFDVYEGPMLNGLRLTTESSVPLSISDRTAQSTLYLAADYGGSNYMALWTGAIWVAREVAGASLALSGLTTDKLYDVFVNWNDGAAVISLGTAWTNDTTRAVALGSQNGIPVHGSDSTKRYIGTIRATSSTTTEDSAAKRYVWNASRQVLRPLFSPAETADGWTYNSTSWRLANANSANKVEFVIGLPASILANVIATADGGGSVGLTVGIGIDATNANSAQQNTHSIYSGARVANYRGTLAAGYHYAAWLERCSAASSSTFYGDFGTANYVQSGLNAQVPG